MASSLETENPAPTGVFPEEQLYMSEKINRLVSIHLMDKPKHTHTHTHTHARARARAQHLVSYCQEYWGNTIHILSHNYARHLDYVWK